MVPTSKKSSYNPASSGGFPKQGTKRTPNLMNIQIKNTTDKQDLEAFKKFERTKKSVLSGPAGGSIGRLGRKLPLDFLNEILEYTAPRAGSFDKLDKGLSDKLDAVDMHWAKEELRMIYSSFSFLLERVRTLANRGSETDSGLTTHSIPEVRRSRIQLPPNVATSVDIKKMWETVLHLNRCLKHHIIYGWRYTMHMRATFLEFWRIAEELSAVSKELQPLQPQEGANPVRVRLLCDCQVEGKILRGGDELTLRNNAEFMRWRAEPSDTRDWEKISSSRLRRINENLFRAASKIGVTGSGRTLHKIPTICFNSAEEDRRSAELTETLHSELFENWSLIVQKICRIQLLFTTSILTQWNSVNIAARMPLSSKFGRQDLLNFLSFVEDAFKDYPGNSEEARGLDRQVHTLRLALIHVQEIPEPSHTSSSQLGPSRTKSGGEDMETDTFYRQKHELERLIAKFQEFAHIRKFYQVQFFRGEKMSEFGNASHSDSVDVQLMFREIVQNAPRSIIWEYLSQRDMTPKSKELKHLLFASNGARSNITFCTETTSTVRDAGETMDEITEIHEALNAQLSDLSSPKQKEMESIQNAEEVAENSGAHRYLTTLTVPVGRNLGKNVRNSEISMSSSTTAGVKSYETFPQPSENSFTSNFQQRSTADDQWNRESPIQAVLREDPTERPYLKRSEYALGQLDRQDIKPASRRSTSSSIPTYSLSGKAGHSDMGDQEVDPKDKPGVSLGNSSAGFNEQSSSFDSASTLIGNSGVSSDQMNDCGNKSDQKANLNSPAFTLFSEDHRKYFRLFRTGRSVSTRSLQTTKIGMDGWPVGGIHPAQQRIASQNRLLISTDPAPGCGYVIIKKPVDEDKIVSVYDKRKRTHMSSQEALQIGLSDQKRQNMPLTKEDYYVLDTTNGRRMDYTQALSSNLLEIEQSKSEHALQG
ncbi:unnamed protein product [Calicophoron daubneyi]|uniref:Uncharacterized protein n=1 Tax=Calicophoron daubneyi TaxID=300641 RepID=A0AAV2T8P0_CALDB